MSVFRIKDVPTQMYLVFIRNLKSKNKYSKIHIGESIKHSIRTVKHADISSDQFPGASFKKFYHPSTFFERSFNTEGKIIMVDDEPVWLCNEWLSKSGFGHLEGMYVKVVK